MWPIRSGWGAVAPKLQANWDWRAAANFVFGGAGTGLMAVTALAGFFAPVAWAAVFLALLLVATGLTSIWFEIGRPWRALNVFLNPRTSWMTREAMAALPFFGFGGLGWLMGWQWMVPLSALSGLVFLYCQARILRASKGIPAWRQEEIVPLIVATGLTEGAGLFAIVAGLSGKGAVGPLAIALLALVLVRFGLWHTYRTALGDAGAPTGGAQSLCRAQIGPGGDAAGHCQRAGHCRGGDTAGAGRGFGAGGAGRGRDRLGLQACPDHPRRLQPGLCHQPDAGARRGQERARDQTGWLRA